MSSTEIQIPVPWGFIAGKSWGDRQKKIIVVLHGWQDNASSFDEIIPYLTKNYQYLCVDFPSHGKSSHLPSKPFVSIFDFVLTIKLILDYLKQDKYILMGHSFGGQAITLFSQIYPECVEKIIVIDSMHYMPIEPEELIENLRRKFQLCLKHQNMNTETSPSYSKEEIIKKIMDGRYVPDKIATVFFERSVEPLPDNKYQFTRAQHLKYIMYPTMSTQYIIDLIKASPVKCPHLIIRASLSKPYYELFKEILNILRSTNKMFETHEVVGPHDIHIAQPKTVANYINIFLLKSRM